MNFICKAEMYIYYIYIYIYKVNVNILNSLELVTLPLSRQSQLTICWQAGRYTQW